MNEQYGTSEVSPAEKNGDTGRVIAFDSDFPLADAAAAQVGSGLISLAFIRDALRRSAWLWLVAAVIGLVAGSGYYVVRPPAAQASVTLLLAPSTYGGEILDDQEIAQSRTVAGDALQRLGLHESAASLLRNYTVLGPTDRILIFIVKAPSAQLAVNEANALASAFLAFQSHLLKVQDSLANATAQRQIAQDQQHVSALTKQISQLTRTASPAQKSELAGLRAQRGQAEAALAALQQASRANQIQMQTTTTNVTLGSRVLDPAVAIVASRLKHRLLYAIIGLIGGLAIGVGLVIVRALTSDRLRRRDDVARALGAPVKLSVPKVAGGLRGSRGSNASQSAELRRIVAYLANKLSAKSGQLSTLAVIPIDDTDVGARSIVSVATYFADHGLRVIVADLCPASPAARVLGATEAGISEVRAGDRRLLVAVPESEDLLPIGPLDYGSKPLWRGSTELMAASSSADVLLAFVALDPALGGDHLSSWADEAVVVVTAGRSSGERINAVGEMIRLAGVERVSAVLVGADKSDASLGVIQADENPARRPLPAVDPATASSPTFG